MAVPMIAVFLTSFNLSFVWYFLSALLLIGIEWMFVRFGLYVQHWWNYFYTFIFLLACFFSTLKWQTMLDRPRNSVKFWTMYLCIVFIEDTVTFYRVALFHTNLYSPGWFSDPIRDHIAGNAVATFVFSIFVTIGIFYRFRWYGYGLLLASNCFIDIALVHLGYLHIAPFWNLFYSTSLSAIMIVLYRWIYSKLFLSEEHLGK
ncbi:MAG: hypothetical protein Q8898_03785 [Bacillota bacterium]|nr:hypothetical protein [Bacillota bacterium]